MLYAIEFNPKIEAKCFCHSNDAGLEVELYQRCSDEIRTTICHCENEQTTSSLHLESLSQEQ